MCDRLTDVKAEQQLIVMNSNTSSSTQATPSSSQIDKPGQEKVQRLQAISAFAISSDRYTNILDSVCVFQDLIDFVVSV